MGLNLKGNLYLGGVSRTIRVAPDVRVDTGFVGCISEVSILHTITLHTFPILEYQCQLFYGLFVYSEFAVLVLLRLRLF